MDPLDRLVSLAVFPPIGWQPPAPGWWLLVAPLPLSGWGLWRLRRHLPQRTIATHGEAPLDSLREMTLVELTALAKPYGRVSTEPWSQAIDGLLKRVYRMRWPDSDSYALSGHA